MKSNSAWRTVGVFTLIFSACSVNGAGLKAIDGSASDTAVAPVDGLHIAPDQGNGPGPVGTGGMVSVATGGIPGTGGDGSLGNGGAPGAGGDIGTGGALVEGTGGALLGTGGLAVGGMGEVSTGGVGGAGGVIGTGGIVAGTGGAKAGTGGAPSGTGGRGTGGAQACGPATCPTGCCNNNTCVTAARTKDRCGTGGVACQACQSCFQCGAVSGSCEVNPTSKWNVICGSASIGDPAKGASWDTGAATGAGLPDTFCQFRVNELAMTETSVKNNSLSPVWNESLTANSGYGLASYLMSANTRWTVYVGDDDGAFAKFQDVCEVAPLPKTADFVAGLMTFTNVDSCKSLTLKLTCNN